MTTGRHDCGVDVSHVMTRDIWRHQTTTSHGVVVMSSALNTRWRRRWDVKKWTNWQMARRTWHSVTDSGQWNYRTRRWSAVTGNP